MLESRHGVGGARPCVRRLSCDSTASRHALITTGWRRITPVLASRPMHGESQRVNRGHHSRLEVAI